jgi:hypothetical protein
MADKKFKTGVDLQSTVKISSETAQRALTLDASGNVTSSSVTDSELGHLSGVTSAVQTQIDSKADLVGGKIPSSQLPAIAITEVFAVADIAARDALTVGTGDGEVQEGDVVRVTDASADANITSGAASYIYDGSAYVLLKAGDEVLSVNGNTGVVTLDADDIDDSATTNKFVTSADVTKLGHISVTQAVDLDTMESDIASLNGSSHDALTLGGVASDTTDDTLNLAGQVLTVNAVTSTTDGAMLAADKVKVDHISVTQAVDLDTMESDIATNNAKVSADGSVTSHNDVSDAGSGIIMSTAERSKLSGIESGATADQTGAEIKSLYEAEADTNAFTDAEQTKLAGIEAGADVTDAANVDAAGATMNTDTDVSANGWVIDEDNMASDLATKVPTQQSVKAYVDAQAAAGGNLSDGDIKETSFSAANNQITAANVTGLAFANATVRSFRAQISVVIDATADLYETFVLTGIQKGASWDMSIESVGDESNIVFSITAAGQVQYTSGNEAGFVSSTMKFRADTTSV